MSGELIVAYLAAGVLFIRSLGGLSKQETAQDGNGYGVLGMTLAILVTGVSWMSRAGIVVRDAAGHITGAAWTTSGALFVAMAAATVLGGTLARRVEMTGMPELVAVLHSFVGLAAVLVGVSSYLSPVGAPSEVATEQMVHLIEVWAGAAVGAITLTGSIVAWAKLRGTLTGKPLLLPGRHLINAGLALAIAGLAVPFVHAAGSEGLGYLLAMVALAAVLGTHLVLAIGGADMPVVVSLLNSYSGWAAAAAGFMLANDLLIVTGALVGSSGTILSIIMCRAMNRSILSVVFGGFGTGGGKPGVAREAVGEVHEMKADEVAHKLVSARSVVIVPGYGMAVSRAQGAVRELTTALRERGVEVRFAIHPVAGRLPGHMNVLLAEAGVPYDMVHEMEPMNVELPRTDVVLVIGANDIVNPGALDDPGSSIYGMPVLEVWKASLTVVLKRGMAAGYAGVENPLFLLDNTRMLFGDARRSVEALVTEVRRPPSA